MNIIVRGKFTVEYRPEVGMWELKEGSAHRGLFKSQDIALAAIEDLADDLEEGNSVSRRNANI